MKVAVLGAGSFGTALAQVFAGQASHVQLWMRDSTVARHINEHHHHPLRYSEIELAPNIAASADLSQSLRGAELVVSAVPMKALAQVMAACAPHLENDAIVVSTTKGIEPGTLLFPHQILAQTLDKNKEQQWAFLSGPNFASEIVRGLPWAAVIASKSQETAKMVQNFLSSPSLRVYYSSDVMGVEIGGAIKNVFAIAAGILDGLELGCNARAALMTRALNEMSRFATALSAEQKTIYGLAGLGDMLLSCTSAQSRNWRVGHALALGKSLSDIEVEMGEVAEGVGTTKAAWELAKRYNVDAPICEAAHKVLYENCSVKKAIMSLMSRKPGEE